MNEFQPRCTDSLHVHVIFGIGRIMDKRELTRYLDSRIRFFLEKMGSRIRGILRSRLPESAVEELNSYGRKLIGVILRYLSKRGLEGPINHLYPLRFGKGWVQVGEAPPDALRPIRSTMVAHARSKGLFAQALGV